MMIGSNLNPYWAVPNSSDYMKYHDFDKCLSVQAIDQWRMPALNALAFRVIFIADDSGKTVNFKYLLKKDDEGQWKLDQSSRE